MPNLVAGSLKQVEKRQLSLEGFYRTSTKDSLKILKIQSTAKKDPRLKEKDSQQVETIFEFKAATEAMV